MSNPNPSDSMLSYDEQVRRFDLMLDEALAKTIVLWLADQTNELDEAEKLDALEAHHREVHELAEQADVLARIAPTPEGKRKAWKHRTRFIDLCLWLEQRHQEMGGPDGRLDPIQ